MKIFALVLTQGFNAIINFFFLPYLVRALSPHDYGTYGQVLLVSDTVRILFSMGMTTILYITLSNSKDQESDFKGNFYIMTVMGALACIAILLSAGLFGRLFDHDQMELPLRIYSLNLLFYMPYTALYALLIFLGNFRRSIAIFTFTLVLRVVVVVVAVESFHSVSAVFYGLVGVSCVQFLMGLWAIPKNFLRQGHFKLKNAYAQVSRGMQLGFIDLIGFGIAYTDKYVVGSSLSVEDFAIYRNGGIELPVIGTLYTSIATIFLPIISNMYANKNYSEIARIKKRIITTTSAVLWPLVCFLIVFSQPLLTAYFSTKYSASALVFAILSLALFFRVNDYMDILVSSGSGRLLIVLHLCAFILNIPINLMLVNSMGYIGAAIGNVVTQSLLLAVLFYYSARVIGKSWIDFLDFKKLSIILTVSLSLPMAFFLLDLKLKVIFLLLFGGMSSLLSYFLFLKLGVILYSDVAPLAKKIPVIGVKIDRICSDLFDRR